MKRKEANTQVKINSMPGMDNEEVEFDEEALDGLDSLDDN